MQVFYADYRSGEHIDSDAPIEMDFARSRRILGRIASGCGFLGVILPMGSVVQFYRDKDGNFSIELIPAGQSTIEEAQINLPLAEVALEATFAGSEVKMALADNFVEWTQKPLPS